MTPLQTYLTQLGEKKYIGYKHPLCNNCTLKPRRPAGHCLQGVVPVWGASWRPLLTSLGSKEMKSRWNWGSITCIMCFTCVGSQLSMSSSKASSFSGPLQLYRRGHFDYLKDAPVTNAPACPCLRRELHGKGPWTENLPPVASEAI